MPKYVAKPASHSRFLSPPVLPKLISNHNHNPVVNPPPTMRAQAAPRVSTTSKNVVKKKGCACSKYAK